MRLPNTEQAYSHLQRACARKGGGISQLLVVPGEGWRSRLDTRGGRLGGSIRGGGSCGLTKASLAQFGCSSHRWVPNLQTYHGSLGEGTSTPRGLGIAFPNPRPYFVQACIITSKHGRLQSVYEERGVIDDN